MSFIDPYYIKVNIENTAGLSFAVKANILVSGLKPSQGFKAWDEGRPVSDKTAWVVQKLLEKGFIFQGTCHTSIFAFDLSGENSYGLPINPHVLNGVPGGSSSGSASVVSQGLADCAIGTDTGGSIRIPAAYCKVWSIRPTYQRISTEGVIPTGPDYDVVGVMAKSADILRQVSKNLMAEKFSTYKPKVLFAIKEFFELCSETRPAFDEKVRELSKSYNIQRISIEELSQGLFSVLKESSILLLLNTWQTVSPWIIQNVADWDKETSSLTKEVRGNLLMAQQISVLFEKDPNLEPHLKGLLKKHKESLENRLLKEQAVILMPTIPHTPPLITAPLNGDQIHKMITLTAMASLMGLPQVQMPILMSSDNKPLGLSIMGVSSHDEELLDLACDIEKNQKL